MDPDLTLLRRYHRQGDAEAFQQLVEAHAGMVHAVACRVTGDAVAAKDVAQETFLALARSSGSAIETVGAWLHTVASRKALEINRGEARRRTREAVAAEQLQTNSADASWQEIEPVLDEAIAQLPERTRNLIIMRYLEGRTQQEAARHLGISQATVSRLLESGISELRAILQAHGIVCGTGLVVLLTTHGTQAAPPALITTLGKLALSGVGAATATLTFTQTMSAILMTPSAKLTFAAVAAVLAAAAGHDLASEKSWLRRTFTTESPVEAVPMPITTQALNPDSSGKSASPTRLASKTSNVVISRNASTSPRTSRIPSPEMVAKLAHYSKQADFKALIQRLYSLKDTKLLIEEARKALGVDLSGMSITTPGAWNPATLEVAILGAMARQHPEETLAWMAMFDGTTRMLTMSALRQILRNNPHITAASIAESLPAGPNREHLLGLLRAQSDPVIEAAHIIASTTDSMTRQSRLWELAEVWPETRLGEAVSWSLQNLTGLELRAFLSRTMHHLAVSSPDQAVAMLGQINDHDLLAMSVVESLHGLVQEGKRMSEVVPVIDRLSGSQRSYAIAELARRWVRVDQDGLMQWINQLEHPADFEATLPLTLPQLSPENYSRAMDTLMPQLDGQLDTAIIKAAMPNLSNSTRTTMDIVSRLTRLPQYQTIGSGRGGNEGLLWKAVNDAVEHWVKRVGAKPEEGARWIDSLPFATPSDKAAVAAKLVEQWKLSAPAAAASWAANAGSGVR